VRFANDYNPFAESRRMFAVARHRGVDFPGDVDDLEKEVAWVEQVLDLRVNEFVPCHNDLYGANILDSGNDLRLIDYDLSGMGDRCYDLGFASAYCELDLDQVNRLCESYFGGIDQRSVARARLFAVGADWASMGLWMVARSMADTNDDYDYAGELANSLRRLRRSRLRPAAAASQALIQPWALVTTPTCPGTCRRRSPGRPGATEVVLRRGGWRRAW
jgi:thiamine kinase-like enzyme